jgi:hypothetical protein
MRTEMLMASLKAVAWNFTVGIEVNHEIFHTG